MSYYRREKCEQCGQRALVTLAGGFTYRDGTYGLYLRCDECDARYTAPGGASPGSVAPTRPDTGAFHPSLRGLPR